MRKLVIFSLVLGLLISSCSTTSGLYKVETRTANDIDGAITTKSMYIYSKVQALYFHDSLSIAKTSRDGLAIYRFEVEICDSNWLFVDTLKLKINNGETLTLVDKNPARKTIPGSQYAPTRIYEIAYFILDQNMVNELRNVNSLVLQHKRDPITLPPEALEAIRKFID